MRRNIGFVMIVAAACLVFCPFAAHASELQADPVRTVKKMSIQGEIAKSENGYIIRGKVPAEIFTILNPDPDTLDEFVDSGRIIDMEVRIVSGDNVEIEKIDGGEYRQSTK